MFRPMIDVLRHQLEKGGDPVHWSQAGALLRAKDKAYLGKNGVPASFKAYLLLAQKHKIISVQDEGVAKSQTISLLPPWRG